MKNVIVIIKNAWGESPPPKVKTGFIPNLCDWEKKNYLTNPGSYYRQKASGRIYSHERMAFHYFAFAELYLC